MYRPLLCVALAQIRVVTDFFHFVVVHDEIKAIRLTTRVVRQYAIDDLGLPKRALDFGTAVAYAHTIEFPWAGGDFHIAHHAGSHRCGYRFRGGRGSRHGAHASIAAVHAAYQLFAAQLLPQAPRQW